MKILMVNDYKEEIGGAEVYMYTLKKALEGQGHHVKVFTTDISKKEYLKRASAVSPIVYLTRLFNLSSFFAFRKIMASFKPDVIHVHSYYELSPAFLFWTKGIRVVMTIHDQRIKSAVIDPHCTYGLSHQNICPGCKECVGWKGVIFEKLKGFIYPFFTRNIQEYIVPSLFLQKQLAQFKDITPVKHIANGFDLPEFVQPPMNQTVCYIGRLVETKGVQVAIQALPTVLKAIPTAKLEICGTGDYETDLKELVEMLHLSKAVRFHGAVSHHKVLQTMQQSDVVVIPSIYDDNLPTVGIEALAIGRPVVASKIGGLPEIIHNKKNGYLVPPNHPDALAEQIIHIFEHPIEMEQMSMAARESAAKFDINTHLKKIINVYTNAHTQK